MVCHFLGFGQVGGSLEAYGEAVELWPPSCRCIVCLHTHGGIFLCDGRDDRRVESAAQEHSVGHVAHELALNGSLQSVVDILH